MRIWSEITGNQTSYKETGLQELIENTPDKEFGREIGDMYLYSSNPGYDGGDKTLLKAQDIKKVLIVSVFLSACNCGGSGANGCVSSLA